MQKIEIKIPGSMRPTSYRPVMKGVRTKATNTIYAVLTRISIPVSLNFLVISIIRGIIAVTGKLSIILARVASLISKSQSPNRPISQRVEAL